MAWIRNRPCGLVYRDERKSLPGYTLFASARSHYANLIDADGRIVHRWHVAEGLRYAKLLPNGNLLVHTWPPADEVQGKIGGSSAARLVLDWDGNVLSEYRNPMLHHDEWPLPNGNMLSIQWRFMEREICDRVQGGHPHEGDPELILGDIVQELTPAGDCVREWRSWEHLDFDVDRICPLESRKEWTHTNAIMATPDGDWLISFRLTSYVLLIDGQTGAIKWRYGGNDLLSHQHAATWLDNGRVLIFDNGCHRRRAPTFSRLLEVDPSNNETVWSYTAPSMLGFYTFMAGGADRLPNGNTYVVEAATGRQFEITPDGETVWEYVSPFILDSAAFGPTALIFRSHRYAADDPRIPAAKLNPDRWSDLSYRIQHGKLGWGEEE